MVASYDRYAFRYKRDCPSQDRTIATFRTNFIANLKFFREKNDQLPKKLIYFRHDESGSAFNTTIDDMKSERKAMIQACREVDEGYEKIVQITMIIVEKERFMRLFECPNGEKPTNVPAGTIVDAFGTNRRHPQFFMVSQQQFEGVARPMKYRIFSDDANHSIDDLQELVYFVSLSILKCD